MLSRFRKNGPSFAALLLVIGCASSPHQVGKSTAEISDGAAVTNSAAQEVAAHDFVEIQFQPGSAILSESSKESLNNLINQANRAGKVDKVLILSWSDAEYPAPQKTLSQRQRDLADKRNQAVESYLSTLQQRVSTDAYNMAEHPSTLSKWFDTTDTRLKETFVAAGLPTTADDPQYPSKSSHSVVLVKVE